MRENIVHTQGKKPVSFSLDTLAKAAYIAFSNNPVTKTVRKDSSFFIDYDKDGNIVGFEIIRLKKVSATFKQVLHDAENSIPAQVRKAVEGYLQPLGS